VFSPNRQGGSKSPLVSTSKLRGPGRRVGFQSGGIIRGIVKPLTLGFRGDADRRYDRHGQRNYVLYSKLRIYHKGMAYPWLREVQIGTFL